MRRTKAPIVLKLARDHATLLLQGLRAAWWAIRRGCCRISLVASWIAHIAQDRSTSCRRQTRPAEVSDYGAVLTAGWQPVAAVRIGDRVAAVAARSACAMATRGVETLLHKTASAVSPTASPSDQIGPFGQIGRSAAVSSDNRAAAHEQRAQAWRMRA